MPPCFRRDSGTGWSMVLLWWFWRSVARFLGVAQKWTGLCKACPVFRGMWAPPSGGSLVFGSSNRLTVGVKARSSSSKGWEGMRGWRKGCFAERNTDRRMVKMSVARNALVRRSSSVRRCFLFTPKWSPANALHSARCLMLWLSLPAARPHRSESPWDDLRAPASARGWIDGQVMWNCKT